MADQTMGEYREPAQWPKVVGIISICWGGFWLLCGGCGLGWMAMMPKFMANIEQQMGEPMPDVMKPGSVQMLLAAIGLVGPVLLLIAGIQTVRRLAAGRTLHLLYAVIGVVMTAVSTAFGIQQQLKIMEWVSQNKSSKWAQGGSAATGLIMMVAMLALSILWPLFSLIWFGAMKKNPADNPPPTTEHV